VDYTLARSALAVRSAPVLQSVLVASSEGLHPPGLYLAECVEEEFSEVAPTSNALVTTK
jgi:hypothetical protein